MQKFGFEAVQLDQPGAPTPRRIADCLGDITTALDQAVASGDLGAIVNGAAEVALLRSALDTWQDLMKSQAGEGSLAAQEVVRQLRTSVHTTAQVVAFVLLGSQMATTISQFSVQNVSQSVMSGLHMAQWFIERTLNKVEAAARALASEESIEDIRRAKAILEGDFKWEKPLDDGNEDEQQDEGGVDAQPRQKNKGITLRTVTETLRFIDSFDGYGMVATDEDMQVEGIRQMYGRRLKDDYRRKRRG
jgi:hypothetical protein